MKSAALGRMTTYRSAGASRQRFINCKTRECSSWYHLLTRRGDACLSYWDNGKSNIEHIRFIR